MRGQCVTSGPVSVAAGGVFAPGHVGELTQVVDVVLVDAVVAETGRGQRRVRLLPARVVVYFVLGLALFDRCSYRAVWAKLVAGLGGLGVACPSVSGLCRARRRLGAAPLAALFEAVAGPVGLPTTPGVFWRGLRCVAADGTLVHAPDVAAVVGVYRKRRGWAFPLVRLVVLVECGTRAVIGAAFGPDVVGETGYARRLVGCLRAGMLLLADAYYDSAPLLAQVTGAGAEFVVRSGAARTPLIRERLPDGSYTAVLGADRLPVRVIEAWVTTQTADGHIRRQQWRLITSLLDHRRYPADQLLRMYHERWQIETTYYSIKSTMLDGRVLRSRDPHGLAQELWAVLTVYQAIVRSAVDAVTAARPDLDPDRISFTIALDTARDQVTLAGAIGGNTGHALVGLIGQAVLANPLPARRQRLRARTIKNPTSKYAPNTGKQPARDIGYTLHTQVLIMEDGLTSRSSA